MSIDVVRRQTVPRHCKRPCAQTVERGVCSLSVDAECSNSYCADFGATLYDNVVSPVFSSKRMTFLKLIVLVGYPEHIEHFYIPDADASVKLWANALNEVSHWLISLLLRVIFKLLFYILCVNYI